MISHRGRLYTVAVIAMTVASPAWSNGDLFFVNPYEIPSDPQFAIFGNIKDTQGRYLEGAVVEVRVAEPVPVFSVETDILGRFYTVDIGRVLKFLGYKVDPCSMEITVKYPGYSLERSEYRGKFGQNSGAIEMDFLMKESLEKNGRKVHLCQ